MRKSRFSEEQIIGLLKEHQAGLPVAEICRRHGISDATFYTWRSKYGGLEISEAKRLKALEEENRKLKKLLAEQVLDAATLREMLARTSDAQLEEAGSDLGHRAEGLRAAANVRAVGAAPKTDRYFSRRSADDELRPAAARAGGRAPSLRLPAPADPPREGVVINHKRLFRVYREERLTVSKRGGRKRALGTRAPLTIRKHRTSAGASTSPQPC